MKIPSFNLTDKLSRRGLSELPDVKDYPTVEQLEEELGREQAANRYRRSLRSTVNILIIVAAVAVLVATLVLPIFQIYGTSMTPTLEQGDIVVAIKSKDYRQGDLIAFYHNNKLLVKRVMASAGEWVDIDDEGNVSINQQPITEDYISGKSKGECDIILPYQVPDGKVFVMGDHRDVSLDSRSRSIGCIADEQIAGRLAIRIWPLSRFGSVR